MNSAKMRVQYIQIDSLEIGRNCQLKHFISYLHLMKPNKRKKKTTLNRTNSVIEKTKCETYSIMSCDNFSINFNFKLHLYNSILFDFCTCLDFCFVFSFVRSKNCVHHFYSSFHH